MYKENEKLASQIEALTSQSCIELFGAYGVNLTRHLGPWDGTDERMLSGVIGFVGSSVRGTCLLAGSRAPLEASCPPGGRVRDWVGELANQMVGRLKAKLLQRGLSAALTTPVVLSGIRLEPMPRGDLRPSVFSADGGVVLVWVEVEATEDTVLRSERPGEALESSEILIF